MRSQHVLLYVYNRYPWPIARRVTRLIEFTDGSYALGWRWSKRSWVVS